MSEGKPMSRREEWLEFWERREMPFLRALPYALLVLCIGFDVAARHGVDRPMLVDLGLALGAAALMAAMDRLDHRTSWTEPQTVGTGWGAAVFATLAGLALALVIRQPLLRLLRLDRVLLGLAPAARPGPAGRAWRPSRPAVAVSQTGAGPYDNALQDRSGCSWSTCSTSAWPGA